MPDLVPVDYQPEFVPQQMAPQSALQQQVSGFPQRAADLAINVLGPLGEAGMTVGDWLRTGGSSFDTRDIAPVAAGVMLGTAAPEAAEGELALDATSRLARAEAMGFRTGMPVYHGSGEAFSSFHAVPTSAEGMATPGVSVALDPEVANEFALGNAQANPQVYPLLHRADRPATLTLDGSETHGQVVGALRDAFDAGHDAVMLKNYTTPGGQTQKNIIIVRDANQLRSPFAKFDPAQKFSANLLAGIGGGLVALPLGAQLLTPVDHQPQF